MGSGGAPSQPADPSLRAHALRASFGFVRVRYGELRPSERRQLAELDLRIERLFVNAYNSERDPAWWGKAVRRVFPGLQAELWGDGRIVVRGEAPELVPIAERVAERAPRDLCVCSKRPARGLDLALERARRSESADWSRARFRAGFSRGHLLELIVYLPGGSASEREQRAAEDLIWDLLGEAVADAWIGRVSVAPDLRTGPLRVLNEGKTDDPPRLGLEALTQTVENAIHGLMASLPQEPSWARPETAAWTLFELEPESAEDSEAQDDLMITSTCEPEMLKCFLSGGPFSSARFSRHQELYFYLKFAAGGDLKERLTQRSLLEDALHRSLVEARVGRVVGGGLGRLYTYVDFVILDTKRGLPIARDLGRKAGLSELSWILPFDDELAQEWLEVVPGSPNPPGLRVRSPE